MIQTSHRGIYEYLWSEHKYTVIGVSMKAFLTTGSRLGKRPQILNWLHRLAVYGETPHPESYNSLLHAYLHIKPHLTREQREKVIKLILEDQPGAAELIYRMAIEHNEKFLFGCRVFFDQNRSICKFWDTIYHPGKEPGLWLCFGPFQLFLTPEQVIDRISVLSGIQKPELIEKLKALKNGISKAEYESWPEVLRSQLADNNLAAEPGNAVFLHPRVDLEWFHAEKKPEPIEADLQMAAALALELVYDSETGENSYLGELPEADLFNEQFSHEKLPYLRWQPEFTPAKAYEWIAEQFHAEKCKESGMNTGGAALPPEHKSEVEVLAELDSELSDVGMEPGDQEVDPE